jgi:hypothetical protein
LWQPEVVQEVVAAGAWSDTVSGRPIGRTFRTVGVAAVSVTGFGP